MNSIRPLTIGVLSAAVLTLITGCGNNDDSAAEQSASQAEATSDAAQSIETDDQVVSYGIGHNMATNIANQVGLEVDEAAFMAGFRDGLAGKDTSVPEEKIQAAFMQVQSRAQAVAAETAKDYLEQNKAKPDVVTTDSGLQYKVLESGDGPKPTAEDTVEVHYHGTLIDGTVFDSSVQRGEPVSFPVNGVIPGWIEALQLMSVGDKWQLTIPPELAYGNRPAGKIPPGSVLNFEVELLGIK